MLPQLAILISFFLIAYFFWADNKGGGGSSQALWIPLIWMFLGGSRFPSQWLDLGAPLSPMASLEGSPTDSAVFLALILGGVATLIRRPINWGGLFRKNIWIWLYFLLGAFSILWSDYPFVTLKRLIKALGNVVMVLIILTDQRPYEAIGVILRRFTFLLIPLSFVFIKYYPDLGRAYHMGVAMFTGVTTHKNSLGQICLISGIYFSWSLLLNLRKRTDSVRIHYFTFIVMLLMITWLLYLANSATSNACLVVAACILVIGRQATMARQPNRILYLTVFSIFLFGLLQVLFNISETLIVMLGRRPDLTTRIPMWEDLIAMVKDPIVGVGYESFWLGPRQQFMGERWGITIQAHNGYLETYLNLGALGLFFLLGGILSGLIKINRHLSIDYAAALLRLCFVVVVLLYNWTEATFYGISIMWIILLLGIMEGPNPYQASKILRKSYPRVRG